MLTAFNYYDPEEEERVRKGIKENPFFRKELALAEAFSLVHPKHGDTLQHCLICGSGEMHTFFWKWGVQYLRCEHCYSIMADVDETDVKLYASLESLKKIRSSKEYQEEGTAVRRGRWEEIVDWLRFRSYRYCGKNQGLSVIDYGNRWTTFCEMLEHSELCGEYCLKNSILSKGQDEKQGQAELILALDYLQQVQNPKEFFQEVYESLAPQGLLILGTKVGSGLDVLLLREKNKNVFPYEHILMPSKEGLKILLEDAGLEPLEFTTPGTFDINYVRANKDGIAREDYFMRYFIDTATPNAEAEFQRFIQRAGLSSYAQIIARKKMV